jgi:hypothetical protein
MSAKAAPTGMRGAGAPKSVAAISGQRPGPALRAASDHHARRAGGGQRGVGVGIGLISPLAMTGIDTASVTSRIAAQSAGPCRTGTACARGS